jgi:branched-chain amino acid transport system permease protein
VFAFVQVIIDGLAIGMLYVLLASGVNLVVSISGILLIAYGQFYMVGAYVLWGMMAAAKLPFWVGLWPAIIVPALLGGVAYRLIFHRIEKKDRQFLNGIVAAIGLTAVMAQGVLLGFGTSARGVGTVFPGIIQAGHVRISVEKLVIILLGVVVLVVLHFILRRTNTGRAMRAVACNRDVAALQGVNASRTYFITMVIGCGLAGFAGAVMSPVYAISPTMGSITLLVLLVMVLGGVGSMIGAIVAGVILGLTLSFGQYYIGTGVSQIIFFAIVGLIKYFRPGGLFGQDTDITA